VRRMPRHHAAILAHHQHPRHGLGGWRGLVPPLAPPRRRGVIVIWDLHCSHPATAGGADAGGIVGAVVAVVVTAAAAAASPCGSAATATLREGSPIVAALLAAHGALDEHRLVGTDASDLSTLAGASVGTVNVTLRTRKQKTELQPLETGTYGGATAYLKVEKARFLFLEGSADAAVAPVAAAAALPDVSEAHADASAVRAAPSTDRPVAGASAPATGACSFAPLRLLATGVGASTSRGSQPPITLLFLLLRRRVLWGRQGESPCCSRSWYSSLCCSRRSRR
jgi:hypothetical protein